MTRDAHTSTLTVAGGDAQQLERRTFVLHVVEGPDAGTSREVGAGHMVIGSAADADLVLADPTISRRHVELRALSDGVLVVDLDSKNGTRVGGIRVKEALLPPDGTFALGSTTVRVEQVREALDVTPDGTVRFGDYLTCNKKLAAQLELLRRVAKSEATVLVEGPTGTGKELLARAIHDASERKDAPFMVVDCSAVSPSLLESQLFGHKKGAFTGAVEDHQGAFEAAQGGTVFLDELGELPLDLQPKLLRALEARTIRRVGEVNDRPIQVRFVAATNRDLKAMSKAGTFRDDLYYRVAVVRVSVPPIAERPEDVPLLAQHYVDQLTEGMRVLSPDAYLTLSQYDWPGNARELRNVIQRALAVSDKSQIDPEDLFVESSEESPASFHEAKDQLIASFEVRYVRALLERHRGNVSRAAKEAGLSRNALYALMKRAGVST
ncbi:MAG: sigma 54-interacting transcriptional regulator [Deltaproteobacteria bacterium]